VDTSKKLKKLTLKLQYLRAELADHEDNHSHARWELSNAIFEVFARAGKQIQPAARNENQIDLPTPDVHDDVNLDVDLKKIVRKIALKTHPDRTSSLPDEEKEYLVSLYRDAMVAASAGDEGRIIEIAIEIGIDIDLDDERHTKPLEVLTDDLEKKIESLKKTAEIAWFNHRDKDDVRCNMLLAIAQNMNLEIDRNLALDIVHWVKSGCPNGTQYVKVERPKPTRIWEKRKPGSRPERIRR